MKNGFKCEKRKNSNSKTWVFKKNLNRLKGAIECYARRKRVENFLMVELENNPVVTGNDPIGSSDIIWSIFRNLLWPCR